MAPDRLQLQRFELKYTITEETALKVRDFVASYLEIDEYGATRPNLSYPIHSLYLDSDQLVLYWNTINGNKNRYKLRLRYYETRPNAPVYFEIKRRMNDAILKQRGAVRREAVDWILGGHLPEPEHLVSQEPKQMVAVQRFGRLMLQDNCRPNAHVSYLREAWISTHDNSVRVTMDRHVVTAPESTSALGTEILPLPHVFGASVILELKFTGRFPNWFRELARVFGLKQGSASKYCDGIELIGEHRFRSTYIQPTWLNPPPRRRPKPTARMPQLAMATKETV